MPDQVLSARTIYRGWFDVLKLRVRLDSGEEIEREVIAHPSGAAVLPYDPNRRVALVIDEARPPVLHVGESRMIEVIAGAIEEDDPEACARREALEEGGLKLGRLDHVARLWATPATSTERVDYYLAAYSEQDRVAPGGGLGEEEEHVRVREIPLAELWRMAQDLTLRDAKTFTLLQALRILRSDLFG
jgi:nudix-type nucleoside diphosphatase (YffH/AdpP family)